MILRAAVAALAAALLIAAGPAAPEPATLLTGADPFAISVGKRLWLYATGSGDALESWSSHDLVHWRAHGPLLRLADIAWVRDDRVLRHFLWAPDMATANGHYYFYYSVGPQGPTPSRIGVARCERPQGPCRDSGRPVLTGGNGFEAIDPMVFVDPRSARRLLYAGGSAGARLRVFELAPDMTNITEEVPVAQPPSFTEGVFVHERGGIYYLSWSHGHWDRSDYEVLYATAPSATGPWTYRGVLLRSDSAYKGPGHHAFVQDPRTGQWLIVYHRWENVRGDGPYAGSRRIAIQPIRYDADGLIEPIRMTPRR